MKITQEIFSGVYVFQSQKFEDNRGFLDVPFNAVDLSKIIGRFEISQTMFTVSKKLVLRGLHFQDRTLPISKLISCINGSIYDVLVDLRYQSETFGRWAGIPLDGNDTLQIFAPVGIAHGFVSLAESSGVFYYQSGNYSSSASCILKWNDPDLAIDWPIKNPVLSDRDRTQGITWQSYKENPIF